MSESALLLRLHEYVLLGVHQHSHHTLAEGLPQKKTEDEVSESDLLLRLHDDVLLGVHQHSHHTNVEGLPQEPRGRGKYYVFTMM